MVIITVFGALNQLLIEGKTTFRVLLKNDENHKLFKQKELSEVAAT